MVVPLMRFFRFGTPVLVMLSACGDVPWWLIILPVIPLWWSTVTTTHEAHQRRRIICRPNRGMSLDEAAAEQKFHLVYAAVVQADIARAEALAELAQARAVGQQEVRRAKLLTTQTGVRG
jgi:hypothetical protein